MSASAVIDRMKAVVIEHALAAPDAPVLLMVSGGSDSIALAYLAAELHEAEALGLLAVLHVNHQLRGEDAEADARFVEQAAALLDLPFFRCDVDVAAEARRTGENIEAVARHERYLAADEALESLCRHVAAPLSEGRIFTAHTADDRVESFYMRSIVGTGPGGFRSMRYRNGPVARPLLDVTRDELRAYLGERAAQGLPVARDAAGALWREDATNAHTDRFRAFVRHEIVPRARTRNPQLTSVLCRTMNLIADEDDMLEDMANDLMKRYVTWLEQTEATGIDYGAGCVLAPELGSEPLPLRRRVTIRVLQVILGPEARVETASVEAVLTAWDAGAGAKDMDATETAAPSMREDAASSTRAGSREHVAPPRPRGGYVANIQGDIAVSANKHGVRLEPMLAFRSRRKRG